jgi:hypothetical protein
MDELTKLKAQAYDCIAAIEHYQKELEVINQKIQDLQNESKNVSDK